jgi:hypothetical protein
MSEGLHQAVFADVRDLGEVDGPYGKKRQIAARLINKDGHEATRWYTPSLNEKATLAKDLLILTGSIPAKFDIDSLVGKQCQVLTTTKTNAKGQPSAKVEKILKPAAGQSIPVPKKSTAVPPTTPTAAAALADSLLIQDEDIPF